MRAATWLHGSDVAEALAAIHEAGRAWAELRERNNVVRRELPDPNRATLTVEETSELLGIGHRRVQQLAQSGRITGRRTGDRWAPRSGQHPGVLAAAPPAERAS
jgi:excisionase family DNA binding protein